MLRNMRNSLGLAIAVAIFASTAQAGPIGYAVNSNATDNLFRIDLSTGIATDLGAISFGDAEGISFGPDGLLYAIGGTVNQLWDITTPPGALVGATGTRVGIDAGLGMDPITGRMFNLNGDSGSSGLYQVNISTGATTFIGTGDQFGDNIAISMAGVAYAIDGIFTDSLYRVDLATGAFTLVGNLGLGNISNQFGSSIDPLTGILWALNDSGQIFNVNTTTGQATQIATVTLGTIPVTGFEGLAIEMAPVPEPTSMALMISGLGLTLAARRRHRRSR
jgi:hypothetical protein